MQITEHQSIQLHNLISYKKNIRRSDILRLARYISDNLNVLSLELIDRILFTEAGTQNDGDVFSTEILIPVRGDIMRCDEFQYRPSFVLSDAVSIRHIGKLSRLSETESIIRKFITEKNYKTATPAYYSIVRNDSANSSDCIIDIYIGIEYDKT